MKILSLLLSLSLSAVMCGRNAHRRTSSMKSLQCDQGFWKRKGNDIEHSCYGQSETLRYKIEDGMKTIKSREYQHLTSFSINNEQYQLFTDKKSVIMTKWNEDEDDLREKQRLRIPSAYSAEVIFHNENAILLVAVYSISIGCMYCNVHDNKNPSRAYHWDHSRNIFEEDHFKNLPSTGSILSFSERYRDRSTVISVFAKCGCNTRIYYLDTNESGIVFKEIDQNNSLPSSGMVIQSVRSLKTQYILFAPLNRFNERESISIFKWTQNTGSLTFHRHLSTYINEETGLSTTVFKNDVFLCSVSDASRNVTIFRLKPNQGHLEETGHIQGEVAFSMCKFFTEDHELYAAVGFQSKVKLLQYDPLTGNFADAGSLPGARNTIDLISFQSRDDAYIVTASTKRHNRSYCKNKVYRKIHSPSS
ncbi:uncharacterized protein LOC117302493 [Asterias rubens]|uniref:uncharacterized protein LOC117302493 n=1 Tax=Asterias rubens TaxID=7604 RepID=UPI001454E6D5|nr:uncharacterized protein LOC117302493 [Asterias rubens]XP_033642352.1 uncharacterized protein LOC117302493 [Asterias rubens]